MKLIFKKSEVGSTEIWTRIAGFKVLSANHYTIEPMYERVLINYLSIKTQKKNKIKIKKIKSEYTDGSQQNFLLNGLITKKEMKSLSIVLSERLYVLSSPLRPQLILLVWLCSWLSSVRSLTITSMFWFQIDLTVVDWTKTMMEITAPIISISLKTAERSPRS